MSSTNPLNPSTGAPSAGPPQLANYQNPAIGQLQTEIQQLQNQPQTTVDETQYNQTYSVQSAYLKQLQDIANGTVQTQAQIQGANTTRIADSQVQGQAGQIQGAQGVQSARVGNQIQGQQDLQIAAQTAQVAAQQRMVAQSNAQNVLSQMTQESQANQQLIMQAKEQNEARAQQLITDQMSLSSMQQTASAQYQQAESQYQETIKQQYMAAQAAQDSSTQSYIIAAVQVAAIVAIALL